MKTHSWSTSWVTVSTTEIVAQTIGGAILGFALGQAVWAWIPVPMVWLSAVISIVAAVGICVVAFYWARRLLPATFALVVGTLLWNVAIVYTVSQLGL